MSAMRRGAGAGPRRLARVWRARWIGVLVCVIGIVALLSVGAIPPLLATTGLGLGAFLMALFRRRIGRAEAGHRGELAVASTLHRTVQAVFGWRPPGARFDVDVVVTWPALAAIEVKHASGRVHPRDDGTVRIGQTRMPGTPLRQAVRGAVSVRRELNMDTPVTALLCVTGMKQRPQVAMTSGVPVVVCSRRHLNRVLRRLPRTDRRTAEEWISRLRTRD